MKNIKKFESKAVVNQESVKGGSVYDDNTHRAKPKERTLGLCCISD